MKLKSFSITSLVAGVCVLAAGFLLPVIVAMAQPSDGSVGIIGGADMPTILFVVSLFLKQWPLCLILLGIALIITGLFSLAFSGAIKNHCTVKTSTLSVAISAVGGLGVVLANMWFIVAAFGTKPRYPDTNLPSVLVSVIAVIAFIALVAWYCKERKAQWSWKGALIDLLTCMLYSPAFFYGFFMLW